MPKYAVEVQYLLPVWACVIVEAGDAEEAKLAVIFDDSGRSWDNAAEDHESSLGAAIEGCREISDEEIKKLGDNPAREQLHDFICGTNTPIEKPTEIARPASSAAVEWACGVGAVRPSRSCRAPEQEQ